LRLVGVEAAQLDPTGPGRLPVASRIAALSVLIVTFRSRSWQVTSPRTLAIDALQAIRRSSSVKLPLRAPRGAPGRAPPGRKYRHHLHVPPPHFEQTSRRCCGTSTKIMSFQSLSSSNVFTA
jgi:hypothetical protein